MEFKIILLVLSLIIVLPAASCFAGDSEPSVKPKVELHTNYGKIVIAIDEKAAPKTAANFINYVKDEFYDSTIFHRVIPGFMIQGGGLTENLKSKGLLDRPVVNEASNGLKNLRGTVAMARTSDPHSATAQFFINTVDNASLDFKAKTMDGWGYCVFGSVEEGMDVVDAIAKSSTGSRGSYQDVPNIPVIIDKVRLVENK